MEDRIAIFIGPTAVVVDHISTELRFLDMLVVVFAERFARDRPIVAIEGSDWIIKVGEDHREEDVEAGLGRELVRPALELDEGDFRLYAWECCCFL